MKKMTILTILSIFIVSVFAIAFTTTPTTVVNQQLINEINTYNKTHNLPWTAGLNPKFNGKTIQYLSVLNGHRMLPPKMRQQIVQAIKTKHLTTTDNMIMGYYTLFNPFAMNENSIPGNYDLRNVNGVSYVTPVKDQGWHGTCWAFSTAETMESAMMKQGVVGDYSFLGTTPILSTQFISYHDVDWNLLGASGWAWDIQDSNYDAGGSQYFSFYNAERYGLPPATEFPYLAYENTLRIRWNPQTPNWQSQLVHPYGALLLLGAKAEKDYFGVTYDQYINAIKTIIMKYGSVSVAYQVPASFMSYKSGIFVAPATPTYVGGHAVQIVGWKSDVTASNGVTYPTVWIVRNSWNTTWGMNGYWEQPAVTPAEYKSGKVPAWKFASPWEWFYSPIFTPPSSVSWQVADFNSDESVNMSDFDMLMSALSETNPSSATIAKYDIGIPKDGRIDGNDVAEFMYLWNKAVKAGH